VGRLQRHPYFRSGFRRIRGQRDVFQCGLEVFITAERAEMNAFAIDGDLQLMRIFKAPHRSKVGTEILHLNQILPIEWQCGVRDHSADGAQGQAFDVPIL
jgi:hypothetical protein